MMLMNRDTTRFSVFENRLSTTFFLSPPPPPLSRFPRAHRPREKEHLSRAGGRTGRSSRTGSGNWDGWRRSWITFYHSRTEQNPIRKSVSMSDEIRWQRPPSSTSSSPLARRVFENISSLGSNLLDRFHSEARLKISWRCE